MKQNFLKNSTTLFYLSAFRIGVFGVFATLSKSKSSPSISLPSKPQFPITWRTALVFFAFSILFQSMKAQSCEAPTDIQIAYVNGMPTAEVNWEGDTPTNGWILLYSMEGTINIQEFLSDPQNYGNPEANIEFFTEKPHLIYMNMLQPGPYEMYVIADCGINGMEASEAISFTMDGRGEESSEGCEAPFNMTVVVSGESAVDISWEPNDGEYYHIAYGPVGLEMNENYFDDPQTGSVIVSENPFHLIFSGPERFEPRSVFLRKFCGDNYFSEWVEPICIEPSNLASSQDIEDITLTWTEGDYESGWRVAYGPQGFDINDPGNPDVTIVDVNNIPNYTLSVYDVEVGVTYDFYVRSKCSEQNLSGWSGPGTFTPILAPCFAVTNTEARHLTYRTADIYWVPTGGESTWTVTYGVSPLDPADAITVTAQGNPKLILTDLLSDTQYDVYVTSICMGGQTAEGDTISFSTTQGSTGGYCTPIYLNGCEYGVVIDHFILTGENNTEIYDLNTGCIDSNYDDRTDESVDLAPGSSYVAWVTSGNISGDHCVIWIDLNDDGNFDETERLGIKSMNSSAELVPISIPETAASGARRMRVIVSFAAYAEEITPCNVTNASIGEVHDYTVNILQIENCQDANAGVAMDNFEICPNQTFTISVTGASVAAEGLERNWQASPSGQNNWTDIPYSELPNRTIFGGIQQAMDYRYKVTCTSNGISNFSNVITAGISTFCYCVPISSQCGGPGGLQINNVYLEGENVILDNDSGGGGSCYEEYLLEFAPDMKKGEEYTLSLRANNANVNQDKIVAWIDYNNNRVFEAQEMVLDFRNGMPSQTVSSAFTIPENAVVGEYRMRVRIGWYFSTLEPCNAIGWGETEDYLVRIMEGDLENCAGTPDGGVATVDPEEGNPNSSYTVTAANFSEADGITYQWQSNTDSAGWINEGGVEAQYTPFQATAPAQEGIEVAWRLEVSCTFSQQTSYSEVAVFTTTVGTGVYCIPELDCTDGDLITNVSFQEIDNISSCSPNGYGDYTAMAATVQAGGTYPIAVTVGGGWPYESVSVWIDFDDNKTFDEDEFFYIGTGSDETLTNDILIPPGVADGDYRMRVRVAAVGEGDATWDMACDEAQGYGETEDYTVTVDGIVSVSDNMRNSFSYYPNPVKEVLYLSLQEGIDSLVIYNLLGQQILVANNIKDGKVDVSALSSGTFIFQVTFDGGQRENFKFIKKQ